MSAWPAGQSPCLMMPSKNSEERSTKCGSGRGTNIGFQFSRSRNQQERAHGRASVDSIFSHLFLHSYRKSTTIKLSLWVDWEGTGPVSSR